MKNFFLLFTLLLSEFFMCHAQLQQVLAVSGTPQLAQDIGAAFCTISHITWRNIQQRPTSSYNWSTLDQEVQEYQSRGIDIYFTLICVSPLDFPQSSCSATYGNLGVNLQSWFPEDTIKWKEFINALVDRYDKDGINDMPGLLRPITHWHIEQEWARIWCSKYADTSIAFAQEFTKYVNMTYDEIKRKQAGSVISFAGIDSRHDLMVFYDNYYTNQSSLCISNDCSAQYNLSRSQILSVPNFLSNHGNVLYILRNTKYDELDIHQYGRWQHIPDVIRWLKDSASLGNRSVIFLEGGGPFCKACEPIYHSADDTTGILPPDLVRDNASYVLYYLITGLESGIKRLHWNITPEYSSWGSTWGDLDLLSKTYSKKPSYFVFRYLSNLLKNPKASTIERVYSNNSSLYYYRVNPLGVSILWSTKHQDTVILSTNGTLFVSHIPTIMGDSIIRTDTLIINGIKNIVLKDGVPIFISGGDFTLSVPSYSVNNKPKEYELYQNYPNPFNSTTIFRFRISSALGGLESVSLKIYDILGREIKTIVNEKLSSGEHSYQFEAGGLSSGIYFYRLITPKYYQTKTMMIIK